jgi:hypothetical protein
MSRRTVTAVFTLALALALALAPAAAGGILPANTAVDDAYPTAGTLLEDTVLEVSAPGVLENDEPAVGATLCVTEFDTTGLQGSLGGGVAEDGAFTFTPPLNWSGTTSFTYGIAATDAEGACPELAEDTGTASITASPVNDAPTAVADGFTALADRTLNIGAPGVLFNDSDVDGDSLTAVKVNSPAHGVLTLAANGAFSYTPADGYRGPDAFSYRASDGDLESATRVVTLNVTAVPTPIPTLPPPTPTPSPTAAPTPTPEPSPSGSLEPSPSVGPSASPGESAASSPTSSDGPGASPAPEPAGGSGGLSLPVIIVLLLLISLLAFGAAIYVPKWLESRRTGEPMDEV